MSRMSRRRKVSYEEDVETASENVKKLLEDPVVFEKWVNETLDMSRIRRRR
jgi:hypothetical protein